MGELLETPFMLLADPSSGLLTLAPKDPLAQLLAALPYLGQGKSRTDKVMEC